MYFKIQGTYFKICALYFSPKIISDFQQLTNGCFYAPGIPALCRDFYRKTPGNDIVWLASSATMLHMPQTCLLPPKTSALAATTVQIQTTASDFRPKTW